MSNSDTILVCECGTPLNLSDIWRHHDCVVREPSAAEVADYAAVLDAEEAGERRDVA